MTRCPTCKGTGGQTVPVTCPHSGNCPCGTERILLCPHCYGLGLVRETQDSAGEAAGRTAA